MKSSHHVGVNAPLAYGKYATNITKHTPRKSQQPLARFREAARDIPEQHCDGQHQERRCGEVVVNVRSARHKHPRQELRKRAQEQERHRHIPVGGCPVQRFAILAQGVAVAFCPHEHRVRKADKRCRPNCRVAEAPDCIAPAGGIHIRRRSIVHRALVEKPLVPRRSRTGDPCPNRAWNDS